jgi:trk system potassium uptake protein TrkA
VGHQLRSIREHLPNVDTRVAAIYRAGRSILPDGDTVVRERDEVFFVAATDDIRKVMAELRRVDDSVKRVVIAGGGNIGLRLAQRIEDRYQVKLIERSAERARRIAEVLRNTVVLHGDAADEELLVEENIDSADVFCAVTNDEEANILSAMLAKHLGAHRVMSLINRPAYAELMQTQSDALDVVISPQTVTIGTVLAHVRRGDVVRVHSLRRGAAEAMEAIAHGTRGGKVVGRRVEEIPLPAGASIVAIVRGEDVIMAHHDTVVEADDHVIVFLTDRRHVEAVEKLFQD